MQPVLLSPSYLDECFSADYFQAAQRFEQMADILDGAHYRALTCNASGPNGGSLVTGVYWQGSRYASRVLVIQSATHGVEGFAGSAIQIDSLKQLATDRLPPDTAILYIHALNPYGFAWLRRVNEEGVDLNRNFVDFTGPLPESPGYDQLAAVLLPDDKNWEAATQELWRRRDEMGQRVFEAAVTEGQYRHADGLFYGGKAPSASRQNLERILNDFHLASRERVAVIDIHTGLGPFGYGEVICDHPPNTQGVAWARAWYGDSVTEPALHTSSSVPKKGLIDYCWQEYLSDRVCFVTLEFGTYPLEDMIDALRHDHGLHRASVDWNNERTQKIKRAMRRFFYPDTPDWHEMVLMRGRQVIHQALNGLRGDHNG